MYLNKFMFKFKKGKSDLDMFWSNKFEQSYNYSCENKNPQAIYDEFYNWIKDEIVEDNKAIKKKELVYLYKTYEKIETNIKQLDDASLRFKLIVLNDENSIKFKKYTINKMNEHKFIKNKEAVDYRIYTDLASWYSNTPNGVMKVILNLYKKQVKSNSGFISKNSTQQSFELARNCNYEFK